MPGAGGCEGKRQMGDLSFRVFGGRVANPGDLGACYPLAATGWSHGGFIC